MITLIENNNISTHVSLDTVREFENQIKSSENNDTRVKKTSPSVSRYTNFAIKKISSSFLGKNLLKLKISGNSSDNYFYILMGCGFVELFPFVLKKGKQNFYIFDAWENSHEEIINFVDKYRVENVFTSSKQAAAMLGKFGCDTKFHWIPEGIDTDCYKYCKFTEKNIDVIQIGRKHEMYHEQIATSLELAKKKYLFEKTKGQIIFPQKNDFLNGLAHSKISLCFPSSLTHPERAGKIETMTVRYLQSMASKCLIVGKAPSEMIEIFGYNPVIEADFENPFGQLSNILDNYNNYFDLIEKNYANLEKHTWEARWKQIKQILISE